MLKSFLNIRGKSLIKAVIYGLVFSLAWSGLAVSLPAGAEKPNFHSVLTRDLNRLIPETRFSRSDRIYLNTTWTGLKGKHEVKVLWIRPDRKVQETTRFSFTVPPGNTSYQTWAWLAFKKGVLNLSPGEAKFIGPWKAQLYLDDRLLIEYPFTVS
jgi:hypothetical protein